jgi:hypothetical protein
MITHHMELTGLSLGCFSRVLMKLAGETLVPPSSSMSAPLLVMVSVMLTHAGVVMFFQILRSWGQIC